ncbi:MAG TPA: hypothetical protein VFF70_10030 [Anaerolineae bacterium]|nr:hypothetical protein [Anaerolineae bacterium]
MRPELDQYALEVLQFLAQTGAQVNQLQNVLRQTTGLSGIASFVESRNYGKDVYLCICLEADVSGERTLTWWMDIRSVVNGWLIEASVLWNGREAVIELPPQVVPDFRAVEKQVPLILGKILEAGTQALVSTVAERK